MKNLTTTTFIIAHLTLICGCQQTFKQIFAEGSEIDKQLVNYALPENGSVVYVSQDNADHPARTLTNGIVGSENWDQGEGWESSFDGEYEYGGYIEPGEREQLAVFSLGGGATRPNADRNPIDYNGGNLYGNGIDGTAASAVGWAVIQFAKEELVTRLIVHTVDSEKYPASQYGISDFTVQYWTPHANAWKPVDRIGKKIGSQHNSIRNNKEGKSRRPFQTGTDFEDSPAYPPDKRYGNLRHKAFFRICPRHVQPHPPPLYARDHSAH